MLFIVILVGSILAGIATIAALLLLFVQKVLKGRKDLLSRVIVGLLVLQFILGMLANLFVQIPTVEPWLVFHYLGPILLHTLTALILIILSVIFLVKAVRSKIWITPAAIGLIAIAIATFCGVTFVNAGQNNIYSFIMSLGFITAFIAYAFVAFTSLPNKQKR